MSRKYCITVFTLILMAWGCASTMHYLNLSHRLSGGMTKSDVESIMGPPIKSYFS